jgi:hypothetical protein
VTNPSGVCFISYSRKRSSEVAAIVSCLHEHGVPTWRDITDLGSTQTETEISETLNSPETASAILFVTPEIAESNYVRSIEAPMVFQRARSNDGFSLMVIAAGGLKYEDVGQTLGPGTGPVDPSTWNILRCPHDPITDNDTRAIAERALDQRLKALGRQTAPDDPPLTIQVTTRGPAERCKDNELVVDFSHRFSERLASDAAWNEHILPGLRSIKTALRKHNGGRKIQCSGKLCLPAAVALGIELMPQSGIESAWLQEQGTFGLKPEEWNLQATVPNDGSGLGSAKYPSEVGSNEVALLVAVPPYDIKRVTDDVRAAFGNRIPFRGIVQVYREGEGPITAGQAVQIARRAVYECKAATSSWNVRGTVHLFLAVPAGLAFMIGQLCNAMGELQTYEYLAGHPQPYVKAAKLKPSNT